MILELTDDEACDLIRLTSWFRELGKEHLPKTGVSAQLTRYARRLEERLVEHIPAICTRQERLRIRRNARAAAKRRKGGGPCPA